ncbi:MAG: thioredoxin family protein [Micrococcales bacterium]|nr:thioredoxin family protein [Micrococcales bacterium]
MQIEILHIDACPNWVEAGRRVEAALVGMGRGDDAVSYRLLTTSAEAAKVPFAGSPTILVDGADAFPAERTADLACRVYRTDTGFAGVPSDAQIREALRRHR